MKTSFKKDLLTFLILAMTLFMFACTKGNDQKGQEGTATEGNVEDSKAVVADKNGTSMEVSKDAMNQKIKASDSSYPVMDEYNMETMGLKFKLSERIKKALNNKEMVMLCNEMLKDGYSDISYAQFDFYKLTDEQRETEVGKMGDEYMNWVNSLEKIGSIGVYEKALEDKIGETTKCDNNRKFGESKDGEYLYYQGINTSSDKELQDALLDSEFEVIEKGKFNGMSAFDPPKKDMNGRSILPLDTENLDGEKFGDENIKKADLTLVNVFATWCTACIQEIPDLEKIYEEYKDKGLNIAGVIMDTVDASGENKEAMEKSHALKNKLGITYDLIKPDKTMMNGRLEGIYALPETFFVDKEGKIVGDAISGSHDYEGWKKIVEEKLAQVNGGK